MKRKTILKGVWTSVWVQYQFDTCNQYPRRLKTGDKEVNVFYLLKRKKKRGSLQTVENFSNFRTKQPTTNRVIEYLIN